MADETKKPAEGEQPAATKSAGGGIKALLPLILTVALMPAIAFAMTKFVLIPQLQQSLSVKAATPGDHGKDKKKETPSNGKRESIPMTKLLVNVAGTGGARFLQVSLSVSGVGGEEFKKKMEEHQDQLKDMAMNVLRTKTIADLEKPNSTNLIRTELITGFNNILGDAMVQEIYFTDFAIQ